MKKCIIKKEHFIGKNSGLFQLYHSNHLGELSINYELPKITVILPKEEFINIFIKDKDNTNSIIIGTNGIINFVADYYDKEYNIFNLNDIEEKTVFNTTITNENYNNYNITCRLWKFKLNTDKLRIICKLYENIESGYIKLNSGFFIYNNTRINILSEMSLKALYVTQKNYSMPFLYAEEQNLRVYLNGKEHYNLEFGISEYNNEILILKLKDKSYNYLILDDCVIEGKN